MSDDVSNGDEDIAAEASQANEPKGLWALFCHRIMTQYKLDVLFASLLIFIASLYLALYGFTVPTVTHLSEFFPSVGYSILSADNPFSGLLLVLEWITNGLQPKLLLGVPAATILLIAEWVRLRTNEENGSPLYFCLLLLGAALSIPLSIVGAFLVMLFGLFYVAGGFAIVYFIELPYKIITKKELGIIEYYYFSKPDKQSNDT
jgi:hypothetical protein